MLPRRPARVTTANRITSRKSALVGRLRAVMRGDEPDRMLLDGVHLVSDALSAGVPLEIAVVASDRAERADVKAIVDHLARRRVEIVSASASVIDAISPVRSPSPVVAIANRPRWNEDDVYPGRRSLVVIAADVQDPGNLGAIVRVAEAGGASGLVAAGACADPFGWKALRGSMGSGLRLPILTAPDAAEALTMASKRGCHVVATTARSGDSLFAADLRSPLAVLIGAEGSGLPAPLLELADTRITIPMEGPVESLNAAVAAAIVIYEARRQKHEGHEAQNHKGHDEHKGHEDATGT